MAIFEVGRIEGMDKTLRKLRQFDIELHKEIIGDIRSAMNSAASLASASYPAVAMRGWQSTPAKKPIGKPFPHYNQKQAQSGIEVVVGKKTGKHKSTYKVAALRQNNAGGMIYDMAGSANKNKARNAQQFMNNLRSSGGRASRVMWPAVRAKEPAIVAVIIGAQKKAETAMNTYFNDQKVF